METNLSVLQQFCVTQNMKDLTDSEFDNQNRSAITGLAFDTGYSNDNQDIISLSNAQNNNSVVTVLQTMQSREKELSGLLSGIQSEPESNVVNIVMQQEVQTVPDNSDSQKYFNSYNMQITDKTANSNSFEETDFKTNFLQMISEQNIATKQTFGDNEKQQNTKSNIYSDDFLVLFNKQDALNLTVVNRTDNKNTINEKQFDKECTVDADKLSKTDSDEVTEVTTNNKNKNIEIKTTETNQNNFVANTQLTSKIVQQATLKNRLTDSFVEQSVEYNYSDNEFAQPTNNPTNKNNISTVAIMNNYAKTETEDAENDYTYEDNKQTTKQSAQTEVSLKYNSTNIDNSLNQQYKPILLSKNGYITFDKKELFSFYQEKAEPVVNEEYLITKIEESNNNGGQKQK